MSIGESKYGRGYVGVYGYVQDQDEPDPCVELKIVTTPQSYIDASREFMAEEMEKANAVAAKKAAMETD